MHCFNKVKQEKRKKKKFYLTFFFFVLLPHVISTRDHTVSTAHTWFTDRRMGTSISAQPSIFPSVPTGKNLQAHKHSPVASSLAPFKRRSCRQGFSQLFSPHNTCFLSRIYNCSAIYVASTIFGVAQTKERAHMCS